MKRSGLFFLASLLMILLTGSGAAATPPLREFYELRVYHLNGPAQEQRVDAFLKDAFIPALHRAGVLKIGVFKPVESDTSSGKLVYVLIPFRTGDHYLKIQDILQNDREYLEAGKQFLDAPYNDPPFLRYESVFMKSFADMPEAVVPKLTGPLNERIYELRAYESATDAKAVKKIEMFNQGGEIKLFKKLGFNIVFFGEVLSGSIKPNLMYLTAYENMNANTALWKSFVDSPEWKVLTEMEEYKNTVSKIHKSYLHPAAYSEF